ncbi:uncharacterized protein LOC128716019 [Anopheles marshallii]|uniref:uncharacterized protein LOC128716019 n=1 Tax=Anopheles marshallii TaxID=1521116 RepID=UPI00237B1234|nr:uncharacterized protein LOC128716019 [Anopheles marshallii]
MRKHVRRTRHLLNRARSCFDSGQMVECFRGEVLRVLDRAIDSNVTFRVTPFVTVRRNPDWSSSEPRNPTDVARLSGWSGLFRKLRELLLSRLFQLSLVDVDGRALLDSTAEGRGKKHKQKGGMFSMALMALMAMIAQVILGKVAVLAAVALIMAKIALVFSTLNGLKKSNGTGGGHGTEVVYDHSNHGGGGGGGWQRSIEPRKPYQRYHYYEEDDLPYWKRRPEHHDYQDAYDGA